MSRGFLLKVIEVVFICAVLFHFSAPIRDFSPDRRLTGSEISFLMNSGIIASRIHQDNGIIPYWNPYMADGEPLIEGSLSYVLNPLMFIPVYIFNYAQSGKIVLLIHIFVMGLGGWTLGNTLGLRSPSRILMALLLGANGSFAAASEQYQMSISQSYVPWVVAGMWGILYTSKRRYIALFIGAFYLFITAGTFWYLLPTGIAVGILVIFNIWTKDPPFRLNSKQVTRVIWAGALALGVSAIRWLPQLELQNYLQHPAENFGTYADLGVVIRRYVYTGTDLYNYLAPLNYHFTISLSLLIVLLTLRILVMRQPVIPKRRWQILIPAFISLAIFTLWAQGNTPLVNWFYDQFTFLREWRLLGRMMAAGSFWLVVLLAVSFDDVLRVLQSVIPNERWRIFIPVSLSILILIGWSYREISVFKELYERLSLSQEWHLIGRMVVAAAFWIVVLLVISSKKFLRTRQLEFQSISWRILASKIILIGLSVVTISSSLHVLQNWRRVAGTSLDITYSDPLLQSLRQVVDDELLPVYTEGYFDFFPFYGRHIRASRGNPDIRMTGMDSTIGVSGLMNYPAEYAIGFEESFRVYLRSLNYVELADAPDTFEGALWRNPDSPSYAFIISRDRLINRLARIFRSETQTVQTYAHQINAIDVHLDDYASDSVLILREHAVPGWRVTVDGNPAQLESIDGFISVRLPFSGVSTVRFEYVPTRLFVSAGISLLSIFIALIYFLIPTIRKIYDK